MENSFIQDASYILKVINFILCLIGSSVYWTVDIVSPIENMIIQLAIPGGLVASFILLILYYIEDRHEATELIVLIIYGLLNMVASIIYLEKSMGSETGNFIDVLLSEPQSSNMIISLCVGLSMLGEAAHKMFISNTKSNPEKRILPVESDSHGILREPRLRSNCRFMRPNQSMPVQNINEQLTTFMKRDSKSMGSMRKESHPVTFQQPLDDDSKTGIPGISIRESKSLTNKNKRLPKTLLILPTTNDDDSSVYNSM